MIIGIDARFAIKNRRGIGNYTLNLIQNLAEIDRENQYILYLDGGQSELLPEQDNIAIKYIKPSNYLLWEQISLPIQAKRDQLDILHCTGNTAPSKISPDIRLIVTLHDVMYLNDNLLPASESYYQRLGRIYRRWIVKSIVRKAQKLITDSNYSKTDIYYYFPFLPKEQIIVVYPGVAKQRFLSINKECSEDSFYLDWCREIGINGHYLLALSAVDPRKNIEFLIQNFLELDRCEKINSKLVLVGGCSQKLRNTYQNKKIIFLDFVSDEDLSLLYNYAEAFIYVPLYEGFGLPPLEAMACGTPVIASNRTSVPEVVGDAALLVDPEDGEQLKSAICSLLADETLRQDLIERGLRRVQQFSWRKMAEETLQVYESVMADSGKVP